MEKNVLESSGKIEKLKEEKTLKLDRQEKMEHELTDETEILEEIKNQVSKIDLKKSKIELELNQIINKMWEEYELTPNNVENIEKIDNPSEVQKNVNKRTW